MICLVDLAYTVSSFQNWPMPQYSWHDCPAPVRAQVGRFVHATQALLADQLVGVYLHGSLAMGCFNPSRSDLDLLMVTRAGMPAQTKRELAELLLEVSGAPAPIEISFLRRADMIPWSHPAPFDLHYSEAWRGKYEHDLASGAWRAWDSSQQRDPDLAGHVTVTLRRGICLFGAAIADVFPAVPSHDYVDSIRIDVEEALGWIGENPVYTVLNACRTYAYLREGHVFSKDEGGVWALRVLPSQHHGVVAAALALYRDDRDEGGLTTPALDAFAAYMRGEIFSYEL
jgi:streptomycin 3"-adenylyltransferase